MIPFLYGTLLLELLCPNHKPFVDIDKEHCFTAPVRPYTIASDAFHQPQPPASSGPHPKAHQPASAALVAERFYLHGSCPWHVNGTCA